MTDLVQADADHRALAVTLAGVCPPAPSDPLLAALQRSLLARRIAEPAVTGRALLSAVADEHPVASARFLRWLEGRPAAAAGAGSATALALPRQDDDQRRAS